MKKYSYPEYLLKINQKVPDIAWKNKHSRNYIHLFRPYNNKSLNVMGSFDMAIEKEKTAIVNFTSESRLSFGMIAQERFETYLNMMMEDENIYEDFNLMKEYIDKNYHHFCIDDEEFEKFRNHLYEKSFSELMDDYDLEILHRFKKDDFTKDVLQKVLYLQCVIAASWQYRIDITELTKDQRTLLRNDSHLPIPKEKSENTEIKKTLYTCLRTICKKLINFYNELKRCLKNKKKEKKKEYLSGYPSKEIRNHSDFSSFFQQRQWKQYEVSGNALYSGVIPRLIRLDYTRNTQSNTSIEKLTMNLGRTSYFTMAGLKSDVRKHPYMKQYSFQEGVSALDILNLYQKQEQRVHQIYWEKMSELDSKISFDERLQNELDILNHCLSNSLSPHNVNVSGNLITSDGYCIYTKRGKFIQDSDNYYCSVNGGTEIYDDQVNFYDSSVEEDKPATHYSKKDFYFGAELTREAIGELGISDSSVYWKYYGVTTMYNREVDGSAKQGSWLHFNVLGERNCVNTFDQIIESRKYAAEQFENEKILGYSFDLHTNVLNMIGNYKEKLIDILQHSKDVLGHFMVFMVMLSSLMKLKESNEDISWSKLIENVNLQTFLTVFSAVLFFASVGISLYKWIKKMKTQKNLSLFQKKCFDEVTQWYSQLFSFLSKEENVKKVDSIFITLAYLRVGEKLRTMKDHPD